MGLEGLQWVSQAPPSGSFRREQPHVVRSAASPTPVLPWLLLALELIATGFPGLGPVGTPFSSRSLP